MLKKRLVETILNRSLPQRKYQFNTKTETEAIVALISPTSTKFHPYLIGLEGSHLRADLENSFNALNSAWVKTLSRVQPKRAVLTVAIFALSLLGVGNSHDFQKIGSSNGLLASNHNSQAMAVRIVSDNVPNFQWPLLGYISTQYSRWHRGIDIPQPKGTPIKPIAEGTVTEVENGRWGYGKSVIITHKSGYASRYAHLSKIEVSLGMTVTSETTVGEVGNTGRSTGNHLHIEIYENGKTLNPGNILPPQPSLATADH